MPEIKLAEIMDPYEFEDRAGAFMVEVVELSKNFPNLFVEADNKTFQTGEENLNAQHKSFINNKPAMYQKAFTRGVEYDIQSTTEILIGVSIHGCRWEDVGKIEKLVNERAKRYRGDKISQQSNSDPNAEDGEYKYHTIMDFVFRG